MNDQTPKPPDNPKDVEAVRRVFQKISDALPEATSVKISIESEATSTASKPTPVDNDAPTLDEKGRMGPHFTHSWDRVVNDENKGYGRCVRCGAYRNLSSGFFPCPKAEEYKETVAPPEPIRETVHELPPVTPWTFKGPIPPLKEPLYPAGEKFNRDGFKRLLGRARRGTGTIEAFYDPPQPDNSEVVVISGEWSTGTGGPGGSVSVRMDAPKTLTVADLEFMTKVHGAFTAFVFAVGTAFAAAQDAARIYAEELAKAEKDAARETPPEPDATV